MWSLEPPSTINSWASASMELLGFYVTNLVAFGESTLLFAVFCGWVGARPRVVRVLTGHMVHIFSLARPLLSALHRLYRFQAHPLDRWRRFSRADVAELRILAGLVWLSQCELGRPFSHVVFCSDATLRRYRVQCTTASFKELKEATRFRERWRFRTREFPHTLPIRHRGCPSRSLESSWRPFSCEFRRKDRVRFLARQAGRAHQQNVCASFQP